MKQQDLKQYIFVKNTSLINKDAVTNGIIAAISYQFKIGDIVSGYDFLDTLGDSFIIFTTVNGTFEIMTGSPNAKMSPPPLVLYTVQKPKPKTTIFTTKNIVITAVLVVVIYAIYSNFNK